MHFLPAVCHDSTGPEGCCLQAWQAAHYPGHRAPLFLRAMWSIHAQESEAASCTMQRQASQGISWIKGAGKACRGQVSSHRRSRGETHPCSRFGRELTASCDHRVGVWAAKIARQDDHALMASVSSGARLRFSKHPGALQWLAGPPLALRRKVSYFAYIVLGLSKHLPIWSNISLL